MRRSSAPGGSGALLASLSICLGVAAAGASEQAGVAAAVRGSVELARGPVVGRNVASGNPILLGDEISSGTRSGMQILLLDETVFTIGSDSTLVIDEFVFDPVSESGRVGARVTQGVFRFVTGKVARNDPADVQLDLPVGSVGIRGTIVAGRVDGQRSTVVLLGPGSRSNTSDAVGRIRVSNAGESVEIARPGFGTVIGGPGEPPTPPMAMAPEALDALLGDLVQGVPPPRPAARPRAAASGSGRASGGDDGGDGEAAPSRLAGQETATGAELLELGSGGIEAGGALSSQTAQAAQDAAAGADLLASFEQLKAITTGIASFGPTYVDLTGDGVATADFTYQLDFGTQMGGGNVHLVTGAGFAGGDGDFPLIVDPFMQSGPAKIMENGQIVFINAGSFPLPNEIKVELEFLNTGQVAGSIHHVIKYEEQGKRVEGSATSHRH